MYTRNRQSQNYGNGRSPGNSQNQGSYTMPYNIQGSYQASQSTSIQPSNYKQDNVQNLQGFKSQQQQQQQPGQMPATASPRPAPNIAPTQQLKQLQQKSQQQMQQQQGQQKLQQQQQQGQQKLQQQQGHQKLQLQQQSSLQQQQQPSLQQQQPALQQQQQQQQQMNQQTMQQKLHQAHLQLQQAHQQLQQQTHQQLQQTHQQQQQQQSQQQQQQQQTQQSLTQTLSQRLKPILRQPQASTTVAQTTPITSQSCMPPTVPVPSSTNNEFSFNDSNVEDDSKSENMNIDQQDAQPRWRRKIPGFKVNKKLKRLRMNQRLRKTLQPKNAIMVLNEMKAGVQFTFPETQGPMPNSLYLVHAELDGKTYVGQGLSKPLARQNAAENALKALLLEKMTAASMKARIDAESDGQANSSMDGIKEENTDDSNVMDTTNTEDEIPWSSLASFALYKLFLEWHNQGTSVPIPRPGLPAVKGMKKENSNAIKTPTQKELPPNPTSIHPVMLLNQMRPGLTYVELSRVGNPPNTMFTLAVEIGGIEYSGTAKNKKDAKKAAAKAALLALYNLTYPEDDNKQEIVVTV